MLKEFSKDAENKKEGETGSKEAIESIDPLKLSAGLNTTIHSGANPDKSLPSENSACIPSQLTSANSMDKESCQCPKNKVSEPSPILKKKLIYQNRASLSPPAACPTSSSYFPGLSKIIENQITLSKNCDSSNLKSHSKSNLSESVSSKYSDSEGDVNVSSVLHTESKESNHCCHEDHSKHDKNSGALSELATGSLATCSSILEVGKEDQQKQKCLNSLSAAKLRLYIASDRIPKHLFENRKLSRQSNGLESERNSNSLDICRPTLQSTKNNENRSLSSKSQIYNCSKDKGSDKYAVKSDFCQVYSCEQSLDTNGQSKSHRPAARKSVIELKSKSLDPPLYDSDFTSAAALEEKPSTFQQQQQQKASKCSLLPSRLPSRSLSQNNPDAHPSVTKRRDSETAVLSNADANWLQKISDKQKSFAENSKNSNSQKSLNIQKLKAFFGETTPKIMEAKEMKGLKSATKDDLCIKPMTLDFQRCSEYASFKFTSSGMAVRPRSKKNSPLCFKEASSSPKQASKKSNKDRESSDSPRLSKEHKTWRGKMAQTLKRYGSGATPPCEQYTGALAVPLEYCVSSFANQYVPLIVETCTRIVEERGLSNVGVYRVPGNSGAVNALIELLNKDPYGLCLENERWQDVNLVSSLLKLFFRRLPDSLITEDLYEAFIAANRLENPERRMLKVKKLIHELPEHNFETFSFLAQHLNRVASHEEDNKMDGHNLAIVFGPTLVRPQNDGMVLMVKDMADQVKVIETIITHCDWLFSSWDEDVYVPVDGDDDDALPVSGMNSVLLEKAEKIDNRSSLSF